MSWIVMLAAGVGCMFAMRFTSQRIDFVLRRVAACCFAGAGTIGAVGWLGNAIDTVVSWVVTTADTLSSGVLGTPVVWILAAGLGFAWVGALVPDRWFQFRFPDWLSYSGLLLPPLLASVPGNLGNGLDLVVTWCGNGMVDVIGGLI
ncbi:MAG: hypothetical protein ACRDS9_09100 [Pseudonocardiaceae bacterium]